MVRFIPKETKFFEMFAEVSKNLTDAARLLRQMLSNHEQIPKAVEQFRELEHRGDDMTHAILTKLNQTFITPFDREDIHRLASSLDDVLDFMNSAAVRLVMYNISAPPPPAAELAKAVSNLEKNQHVLEHCVEINRLENEADLVSRKAIARLFEQEKDPISLIKMKELYEVLETATDKAEDAANVLEAVVLKSA
jgi:uncharacterized protein Yka (UPF0111/DUF47 family)